MLGWCVCCEFCGCVVWVCSCGLLVGVLLFLCLRCFGFAALRDLLLVYIVYEVCFGDIDLLGLCGLVCGFVMSCLGLFIDLVFV